ncbi:glycosyltransferase [Ruminococcus sp.]|uniref:glycosyltransferase family 2 protein n=1 Tax=Ruminococcus sp. TaxID=41978 RepID=UPI002590F49A|nr:glycosyltransferase [Ruminococcus sp.]MCR5020481.1 glycosyltransferase [Ruminococcus sp.]
MNDVSVDILVTFYNQEEYINQALTSVFEQKGDFNFRVLVGDDGSSDCTPIILNEWEKRFPAQIKVFTMHRDEKHHLPGGFRASRNRLNLLKHVDADYFIFLDGDDYFDNPNKLQMQIEELEKGENQDCIACGHDIDALYRDGNRKLFAKVTSRQQKYTLKEYWSNMYSHTDTIVFRREAISGIPFYLIENSFNDNTITYLFLRRGKLLYLPKAMAVYRQTGDGIWTGETEIVSMIREMMLFDIANQLTPELKCATRSRFAHTWMRLFTLRKMIDQQKLEVYENEATEKHLQFTQKWIHFNSLDRHSSCELYFELIFAILSRIVFKLIKI